MSRILFFLGIFIVIAVAWSISRRRSELTIKERDELEELRRTQKGARPLRWESRWSAAHTAGRIFLSAMPCIGAESHTVRPNAEMQTNRERRHFHHAGGTSEGRPFFASLFVVLSPESVLG